MASASPCFVPPRLAAVPQVVQVEKCQPPATGAVVNGANWTCPAGLNSVTPWPVATVLSEAVQIFPDPSIATLAAVAVPTVAVPFDVVDRKSTRLNSSH